MPQDHYFVFLTPYNKLRKLAIFFLMSNFGFSWFKLSHLRADVAKLKFEMVYILIDKIKKAIF